MTRRLIGTGSAFEARYRYSRAVVEGGFVFVAGTTGYDYAAMTMSDDLAAQTRAIFVTLERVLREAGSALERITRLQIFVTHADYCEPVLTVMADALGETRPAMTILVVAGLLTPQMKVEIEATARQLG